MTLGLIFMVFSWFIDGKLKEKATRAFNNKLALILSSIYLISVFGLIHTSNYSYGFNDVRKKLSLFLIPILIAGFESITKKEFLFLLKVYVGWVAFSCCWSFCVYMGITGETIVDKRDYSRYTSHIRFGLEIALAFFISIYLITKSKQLKYKIVWLALMGIMLLSLYAFSMITGTVALLSALTVVLLFYGFSVRNKPLKIIFYCVVFGVITFIIWFAKTSIDDFYANNNVTPIEEIPQTIYGDRYQKDAFTDNSQLKENGYYLEKNIAWYEFSEAWNERSSIHFEEKDLKGNWIKYTLIRYVTSQGKRKDKEAIDQLTDEEVTAIEMGIPNHKYLSMNGFRVRMHKIIWEFDAYKTGRDINGHSVLMRWEYLKVTLHLIKNNFWWGIGTGDIKDAYQTYYQENQSRLQEQYRRRGHNQYLTYFVTLGVLGGVWFLFALFYPFFRLKLYKNYVYLAFFTIICISMLTEDTLENQVGIYFFVFFNSLFSLRADANNHDQRSN